MALASRQLDNMQRCSRQMTLELYQYAIQFLLQLDPAAAGPEILAACTLLCIYEMMASDIAEWKRHLEGCAGLLSLRRWNGSARGIVKTCFWAFARIDVWAAFSLGETTLLPTTCWVNHNSIEEVVMGGSIDDYCNLSILLFAEIVNCINSRDSSLRGPLNSREALRSLWDRLQDWRRNRPAKARPILRPERPITDAYPQVLFSNHSSVCGNTYYHAGSILLLETNVIERSSDAEENLNHSFSSSLHDSRPTEPKKTRVSESVGGEAKSIPNLGLGGFYFDGFHLGGISSNHGVPFFSAEGEAWIFAHTGFAPLPPNIRTAPASIKVIGAWELPNRIVVETYFSAFVSSTRRLVFPLVDEASFTDTLDKAYNSLGDQTSPDTICAKAYVLAFTCVMAYMEGEIDGPHTVQARQCAARANSLMPGILAHPSIESIQVCNMLCMYSIFSGNVAMAATYLSIAYRFISMFGAHINAPSTASPTLSLGHANPSNYLRRVFWNCYLYDKDICLRAGYPPIIDDDHCDLTLPPGYKRIDDFDTFGDGSDWIPGDMRVTIIKSRMIRLLYCAKSFQSSEVELLKDIRELDDELENWRTSIAPQYRPQLSPAYRVKLEAEWNRSKQIHVVVIHFEYYFLLALIHSASGRCRMRAFDKMDPQASLSSCQALALQASRLILANLAVVCEVFMGGDFWFFVSYPMFASLTIFCNILTSPLNSQAEEDLALLRKVPDLLIIIWQRTSAHKTIYTMAFNYIVLSAIISAGYVLWTVFQAFRNPLNDIPGPWYAKFTALPGTLASISRQQVQYHHRLHQKYGPFVRVGPSQVFVSDIDAFKAIHKIGAHFDKASYYHYFGPTEAGKPPYGLFQMTDASDHAKRRKLLGRGFTAASLRADWESTVAEKASSAINGMRRDAELGQGEADVRKWWVLMASDVISKIMFGESFDGLKIGKEDPWAADVKIANIAAFVALAFPWLYALAKHTPLIGRAQFFHAHKALIGRGAAAVVNSRQTASSSSANLFKKVLEQADKDDSTLKNMDICVEAGSFMIAGTDTTSNTLTYLIWAVLSQPELQGLLETEVERAEEPFTDASLEKLPILHATIEETLRLYGAAPTPLPRIVPAGGVELGGFHLPGGTEVATQAWTMHRDPEYFREPERFDHTRWLPTGECSTSETAKAAFTPFGAGSRVCIGKHLAYMELRYGAAFFFRAFKGCRLAPSATPESMEMNNLVLIEPRGKALKVILPKNN
ncbi:Cytochrome P450 monooxygenase cypX [Paramyrothecium foliicola]|nr:Cytochrome P450 monooxygenase cypX [Paramyrothecium foliicola]